MNNIGIAPNQIPVNGMLGEMAFQDPAAVNITGGLIADKPVGALVDETALNLKLDATATAADSSKLGGQLPSYYATAAQVGDVAAALDIINGEPA